MRLHPISVVLRAIPRGMRLGVTLFFLGVLATAADLVANSVALAPLVAGGFTVGVVWEFLYYRRFEYALTHDTLDVRSGVISRRNREIPLRRVQNVDISRNVLQRILGIAVISVETAGGGQSEVSLQYVSYEEAKRMQHEIRQLKREVDELAEESEPEPEPETTLFQITPGELALLSLSTIDLRPILPVLVVASPVAVPYLRDIVVGGAPLVDGVRGTLLLIGISWVVSAAVTITRHYGFTLTRIGDELRYERGLFQRYDGSIPLARIQTFAIRENIVQRRIGYATLTIETAGYSPGQAPSGGSEAAVPIAGRGRIVEFLRSLSDVDADQFTFERPPKRARLRYGIRFSFAVAALTGVLFVVSAATGWFDRWYLPLALLVTVPVLAHYRWLHRGYALGDEYVATRNGFLNRSIQVVPYHRIQTAIQRETIFQRRWNIATVIVDTAGSLSLGRGDARAVDIDTAAAADVRETLADRLLSAHRTRVQASSPTDDQ